MILRIIPFFISPLLHQSLSRDKEISLTGDVLRFVAEKSVVKIPFCVDVDFFAPAEFFAYFDRLFVSENPNHVIWRHSPTIRPWINGQGYLIGPRIDAMQPRSRQFKTVQSFIDRRKQGGYGKSYSKQGTAQLHFFLFLDFLRSHEFFPTCLSTTFIFNEIFE